MYDTTLGQARSLLERCERERDASRREAKQATERIEDALLHYEIGAGASAALLYVDWQYVAGLMAAALRGEEATG